MVDENLTPETPLEEQPAPTEPIVIVKVAPPESRFLFVDVASLRAKQLRRGARPRIEGLAAEGAAPTADAPRKPERVAMEEVRQGLVAYEIPKPQPEPAGEEQ